MKTAEEQIVDAADALTAAFAGAAAALATFGALALLSLAASGSVPRDKPTRFDAIRQPLSIQPQLTHRPAIRLPQYRRR